MELPEAASPGDPTSGLLPKILLATQLLYFQADTLFSELMTNIHALMLDNIEVERQKLTAFVATWKKSTLQQRVLSVLETHVCLLRNIIVQKCGTH